MKHLMTVPIVFLFQLIVFGVLIAFCVWLFDPAMGSVLAVAGPILTASLFPAVLFSVLRGLRKSRNSWLFLLVLGVSIGALLFGISAVHTIAVRNAPDDGLQRRIPVGVIINGDDYSFRIGDATGVALSNIIVVSHREIPTIGHYERGVWNAEEARIVFPDGTSLSAEDFPELRWRSVPSFVRGLAEEVTALFLMLHEMMARRDFTGLAYLWGAFVLSLLAVWTPARLFRWPLLNIAVAIGYLRLIPVIPTWTEQGPVADVLSRLSLPDFLPGTLHLYPFTLLWTGSALLLLMVSLFLSPLGRWQREIGAEGRSR